MSLEDSTHDLFQRVLKKTYPTTLLGSPVFDGFKGRIMCGGA